MITVPAAASKRSSTSDMLTIIVDCHNVLNMFETVSTQCWTQHWTACVPICLWLVHIHVCNMLQTCYQSCFGHCVAEPLLAAVATFIMCNYKHKQCSWCLVHHSLKLENEHREMLHKMVFDNWRTITSIYQWVGHLKTFYVCITWVMFTGVIVHTLVPGHEAPKLQCL